MTKIHYVGCDYHHSNTFIYDIPEGHDFWLLLLIKTPAFFAVNGEIKEYPAHSAVLFPPHQPIYYRASRDYFNNDWIRFDTNESYIANSTLPLGSPFPLDDPEYCYRLMELLSKECLFQKDFRETSIDYLLHTLFNKLQESYKTNNITPQYYNLLKLRTQIHNNPGRPWTIAKMSETIHLSSGYLQSIYKETFGVSCMEDVIQSRIRLAKEYLSRGNHSTSEIAHLCGYHNVEHFCRQFKNITGTTPGMAKQLLEPAKST